MSTIKCKDPKVILNPYFEQLYRSCDKIITPYSEVKIFNRMYHVPVNRWHPKKKGITPDEVDRYNFVNSDGEFYPLYVVVPCGKCLLCKEKRRLEWSFRCLCEARYSKSTPLFITLTYAKEPEKGLSKSDVQKWFKRLRITLTRQGYNFNLRYFICGEYGSKTKRAHYHAILYNFPWLPTWDNVDHVIRTTWKHGFIMVAPVKYGCTSYVAKYMRKECIDIPGKFPPFYLSSRKNGGLGVQYCREMTDWFRAHPTQTTITATDPYTGASMTVALPRYFKDKIFASRSRLISKEIRDCFQKFQLCYAKLLASNVINHIEFVPFTTAYESMLQKYCFLPKLPMHFYPDLCVFKDQINEIKKDFCDCYQMLYFEQVEVDNVLYILDCLNRRNIAINMSEFEDINIVRCEEELKYKLQREKEREIF